MEFGLRVKIEMEDPIFFCLTLLRIADGIDFEVPNSRSFSNSEMSVFLHQASVMPDTKNFNYLKQIINFVYK